MAPERFFNPILFRYAWSIELTSAITIFEHAKKAACVFPFHSSLIELKIWKTFWKFTYWLYKLLHSFLYDWNIFFLVNLLCKNIEDWIPLYGCATNSGLGLDSSTILTTNIFSDYLWASRGLFHNRFKFLLF